MSRSKGGAYTCQLYFDPRADDSDTGGYSITDQELRQKLSNLIDANEKIQNASIYSNPLSKWQLTNGKLYHAFIVIQTLNWWWSIEKNTEGITIQRSRDIESVRDMYQRKKRTTGLNPWTWIRKIKTTQGRNTTINELINYIWRKDVLNKGYHVLSANCQKFAALLFDRIESFKEQVYFDEAADQSSSTNSFYMTVDKAFDEVRRFGGSEPFTKQETYKLRIPFKRHVCNLYLLAKSSLPHLPFVLGGLTILIVLSLNMNFSYFYFHFKEERFLETADIFYLCNLIVLVLLPPILLFVVLFHYWCTGGKHHIVMIFETQEGTYWSLEQLNTRLVIHRAKNKDVLLNECQRQPRRTSLKPSKMVEGLKWKDMNDVMECFCKNQKHKKDVFQSVVEINVISSLYNKIQRKPRRETVHV